MVLNAKQQAHIATLPQKVASQVKSLMERGWFEFARTELRAGRNPAAKGWQKVLCDALLVGNPTRPELELAMATQLNLSASSARVQASVGIAIFAAGRLAIESFGRLTLSPNAS